MSAFAIVGASIVWGVVHSLLASTPAKKLARRVLDEAGMRAYRLGYNAFAVLSFLPILLLVKVLPDRFLYAARAPWLFVMLLAQALAFLCLLAALLQTDTLHFAGIRQLVQRDGQRVLVTTGFYRMVRHPLYLFGLLIIWLTPVMTVNLLSVVVVLSVYIFVGAELEERRLLTEFGEAYIAYRARTPMIIPGLMFSSRLKS